MTSPEEPYYNPLNLGAIDTSGIAFWKTNAMPDLRTYRTLFRSKDWISLAQKMGNDCIVPVSATVAIEALCDEVERLNKLIEDARK